MPDLALYSVVGGTALGTILVLTRPHMTARATWLFSMLYYVLFTGLLNIRRFFNDYEVFESHFYSGFSRALLFATAAGVVVYALRIVRRERLDRYIHDLEEKNTTTRQ